MADKGKGKKRVGLGANPLDWIKDTSEAPAEVAPKPKRKTRAKKADVKKGTTAEVPKAETAEVPTIESAKEQEIKTQEVPEIKTKEVQELEISKVQEESSHEVRKEISNEVQDEEMLELSEMITQEGLEIPRDAAYLESDPLYRQYKEAQLPKYQRLDVKLYVLLRDDQLEFIARLTREIMKNRASEFKVERITKNTIIRALIDNLKEFELDVRNIPDEVELAKRIADAIRAK